jgi:hypothetical protein
VPFSTAYTFVISVGTGTRGDTGWTKLSSATVIAPPDMAASCSNCDLIQSRAAPMPRTGSVCDDSVWRVPKDTSLRSSWRSRRGLISASMRRTSAGGCHQCEGASGWSRPRAAGPLGTSVSAAAASANAPERSLTIEPALGGREPPYPWP